MNLKLPACPFPDRCFGNDLEQSLLLGLQVAPTPAKIDGLPRLVLAAVNAEITSTGVRGQSTSFRYLLAKIDRQISSFLSPVRLSARAVTEQPRISTRTLNNDTKQVSSKVLCRRNATGFLPACFGRAAAQAVPKHTSSTSSGAHGVVAISDQSGLVGQIGTPTINTALSLHMPFTFQTRLELIALQADEWRRNIFLGPMISTSHRRKLSL